MRLTWRFYLHPPEMGVRVSASVIHAVLEQKRRIVLYHRSEEALAALDEALWTQNYLILHGRDYEADQPVWLTSEVTRATTPPNGATVLFLPQPAEPDEKEQMLDDGPFTDVIRPVAESAATSLPAELSLAAMDGIPTTIKCWRLHAGRQWQPVDPQSLADLADASAAAGHARSN